MDNVWCSRFHPFSRSPDTSIFLAQSWGYPDGTLLMVYWCLMMFVFHGKSIIYKWLWDIWGLPLWLRKPPWLMNKYQALPLAWPGDPIAGISWISTPPKRIFSSMIPWLVVFRPTPLKNTYEFISWDDFSIPKFPTEWKKHVPKPPPVSQDSWSCPFGCVWKCCVAHCTQWFCWSLSRF